MSDMPTPRTDSVKMTIAVGDFANPEKDYLEFALVSHEQLERELAEAKAELTSHKEALEKCEKALNESLSVHGWPHAHIDEALSEIAKLKGTK